MTPTLKQYIKDNKAIFDVWIATNADIQISHDLLTLIIPEFLKENPGTTLTGSCPECIIDMLRWARMESKPKKDGKNN